MSGKPGTANQVLVHSGLVCCRGLHREGEANSHCGNLGWLPMETSVFVSVAEAARSHSRSTLSSGSHEESPDFGPGASSPVKDCIPALLAVRCTHSTGFR